MSGVEHFLPAMSGVKWKILAMLCVGIPYSTVFSLPYSRAVRQWIRVVVLEFRYNTHTHKNDGEGRSSVGRASDL